MSFLSWLSNKTVGIQTLKPRRSQRRYEAAAINRLTNDFSGSISNADSEIRPALRIVRARCRDQGRNNDYAKRYLNILKSNVVGDVGVTLQIRRWENGKLDQAGNNMIEAAWKKWCKKGVCTMDGRLSFHDTQALFISALAQDGEVLIEKIRNAPNVFGFALNFLEADYLAEEKNERLNNGNYIRMGVECDKSRKPIAYHLFKEHPGETWNRRQETGYLRVNADQLLHAYIQERPEQTRGMPFMATALSRLKMLAGYEEAELVAARVSSSKMGFFTSPDGDGYTGEDIENAHEPVMNAEPGTFEQLPAGMDLKMFDPSHPTTAFPEFEKAILRGISSGLNISYVSLSNNLEGVSYSSIRQGTLEDRDHFRMLQRFLIDHYIEPVFREWLLMAMTTGVITLPINKYDDFATSAIFRPRGWTWIDPQNEINAQVAGLNNGITTMQDIHAEQGRDTEEIFQQIQLEKELADTYGIQLAFQPFGIKQPAFAQTVKQ